MAELRIGASCDIFLKGFPYTVLISNSFTEAADRQDALQRLHFLFQRLFLAGDLIHQVSESDKHNDSYGMIPSVD